MPFMVLGLNSCFIPILQKKGITEPTAIQKKVIPSILAGRDILACAQTGTGKTASFLLPIIDILDASRARARIPRALIISPTRELALQTAEQAELFSKGRNLQIATLIGGTVSKIQVKTLKAGADIVIATPGRLSDIINRGQIIMRGISIAVIDEADRMLDMGFIPAIEEIFAKLPKSRQTLMFSATLPSGAKKLAGKFLSNPKEVTVELDAKAVNLVDQAFIISSNTIKNSILLALLHDDPPEKGIIFCNRKTTVDKLYKFLIKNKFRTIRMHGNLTQENRISSLEALKKEINIILVCSNVASRGLDVQNLSHVYNFDFPDSIDDYVHRIGRTGRAGNSGKALTFMSPDFKKNLSDLRKNIFISKASVVTFKNNNIIYLKDDKNLTFLEAEINKTSSPVDSARHETSPIIKNKRQVDKVFSKTKRPTNQKRPKNLKSNKNNPVYFQKESGYSLPDFITLSENKNEEFADKNSDFDECHNSVKKKNYFDKSNLPAFLK